MANIFVATAYAIKGSSGNYLTMGDGETSSITLTSVVAGASDQSWVFSGALSNCQLMSAGWYALSDESGQAPYACGPYPPLTYAGVGYFVITDNNNGTCTIASYNSSNALLGYLTDENPNVSISPQNNLSSQIWTLTPILASATYYTLIPNDSLSLILTAQTSDGAAASLQTTIQSADQNWKISGTQGSAGFTSASLQNSDGYFLNGTASGQTVTCSNASPANTWTITNNGDGTATFENMSGTTSNGFLTDSNGTPTLQPPSNDSNQQWLFIQQILVCYIPYTFNANDALTLILTAQTSNNAPAELETGIHTSDQTWTIGYTPWSFIGTGATLQAADGYYLNGIALGKTVQCSQGAPANTWNFTDNGDGTATFECILANGNTSLGFLTDSNGTPTLQTKSGGNNQKWKFTTTSTKGKGR